MSDLVVDEVGVSSFVAAVSAHASVVGAECSDLGSAVGSWTVADALGNVSVVLTVLDRTFADASAGVARDARMSGEAWRSTDSGMAMRPV